jgi:hypothetical protein
VRLRLRIDSELNLSGRKNARPVVGHKQSGEVPLRTYFYLVVGNGGTVIPGIRRWVAPTLSTDSIYISVDKSRISFYTKVAVFAVTNMNSEAPHIGLFQVPSFVETCYYTLQINH